MSTLHLSILSPEKEIFNGDIKSITLPGDKGRFTILYKHSPIISSLNKGVISFTTIKDEIQTIEINEGFIEMSDNNVSVCVEMER